MLSIITEHDNDKLKLMEEQMSLEDLEDEEQQTSQQQKKDNINIISRKKIYKKKNKSPLIAKTIEHYPLIAPVKQQKYYQLNGNFTIYIQPQSVHDFDRCIKIDHVEKYGHYYQANLVTKQFIKNFQIPIELLEKSQNQQSYQLAQQLKDTQQLFIKAQESFKSILKHYKNKKEELKQLTQQRSIYKKQQVHNYIKENLKDDDFYAIAIFRENFEYQQVEISSIIQSESFMVLLGIDQNEVHQHLLHIGMLDYIILTQQEMFYGIIIDLQKKRYFDKNIRSIFYKDFIFHTIEKIKVYCDIEVNLIDVEYPPHLDYQCQYDPFPFCDTTCIKFNITPQHIKSIIGYRQTHQGTQEYGLRSIEYQFLSSIFVDKFYPVKEQSETIMEEEEDNSKICKYRSIL
ncbi:hypothetical protein TTHERM_00041620 (macronuclear) [Tetrahymena thermophila SB210]|uniref:Uncharacterized protein n=1 Tax=Tetrahymena thermophila (strain SB210) TaxID=312017 RepID=Q22LV5_TETTS|nr:hypothetical protein TTHERM_00041620 [Tetrahymena thermophila SB210]EAR86348.2 hypothetical protein TTHERM_00041620 [Tetrahymena thermophila SB210]|eukprot:XP_977265.2 hypothetical protein TTHERM_00041620 [Tetrahymena thermophila SB210]